MKQTVDSLKKLFVALGGDAVEVADLTLTPDVINAIAGFVGVKEINVQPDKASATYPWTDKTPADMQTDLVVADGAITGTLKFIAGGLSPSGPLAGDGNFMALKFVNPNNKGIVKVGLVPSASGMGLVELDEDMNAVFKVSGKVDGIQQVLKIETTIDDVVRTQTFDLTGLVLNTEA